MLRFCSYCKKIFGIKPPYDDDNITHGICPECYPGVMKELRLEMKKINRMGSARRAPEGTEDQNISPGREEGGMT